jgi:hypothetical protein
MVPPMNVESRAGRSAGGSLGPVRLSLAVVALAAIAVAGLGAQSAGAAKSLKAPRPGSWKIIAAANTPHGLEVKGGVIGSFRVTKHSTVVGFHLDFTEEGESVECAGGRGEEDSPRKSGAVKFAPGASAPIIHAGGAWVVAVDTGTIGGGSLQGAEVNLISPNGSFHGLIDATLVTRKGERSGEIGWNENECGVAFVVKPG